MTLPLHVPRHLARAIPRGFQELLVDDLHEAQVLGALTHRPVIQRLARQLQQRALTPLALLMILAHHFLPRVPSSLTEALAIKSRSTTSCPIFECSFSISASFPFPRSDPRRVKAVAMLSIAAFGRHLIPRIKC